MKERYQIWLEKMTKKELALIAKAEERAEVRKVDLEKDMKVICESSQLPLAKAKGLRFRVIHARNFSYFIDWVLFRIL